MSLIRIEMQGFKSFAPKTVIKFDNGFTGIVGPNGCGKSNVVDAIRWVLGERSAKQIRGEKMTDVIFDGAATRKPMGYAEVSLVFDNTDKMFSLEIDEIIISRKLFRSGKSGYFINNRESKLSEIISLMRDTGAGKEGYSIIGQGKVSEIMEAKPEERRAIFEEAAGIAKTKAEKKSTESKLAGLAVEIQRGKDILDQKDQILAPLLKQVENFKKYKEFKAQLRYQEINYYLYNVSNNKKIKEQTEVHIAELAEIIGDKQAEIAENERKMNALRSQSEALEAEVRKYMQREGDLRETAAKANGEMTMFNERLGVLTKEIQRLEGERTNLQKAIAEYDIELAEANNILEIKRTEHFNAGINLKELEARITAVNKELEGSESSLEQGNDDYLSAMNLLTGVKTDEAKLTTEISSYLERKERLDTEIRIAKDSLASDTKKLTDAKNKILEIERKRGELRQKRQILSNNLNETQTLIRTTTEEKQKLAAEVAILRERINSLQASLNSYDNYQGSVKQIMMDAENNPTLKRNIYGVIGRIIHVPAKYTTAIDVALGNNIQNILVPNEESAKVLIDYMKTNEYGRITCMPFDSLKATKLAPEYKDCLNIKGVCGIASDLVDCDNKYTKAIVSMLGRTVVVESMEVGNQLAKTYDYGFKIVTLDGEFYDTSRKITGGSMKEKNSAHLGKERELADNQQKLKVQNEELEKLTNKLKSFEDKYVGLQKLLAMTRDDAAKLDNDEGVAQTQIETYSQTTKTLEDNLTKLEGERATVEMKLSSNKFALSKIAEQTSNIEGQQKSAGAELQKAKNESINKKKLKDTLSENQTNIKLLLSGLDNEIRRIEDDIKRLDSSRMQAAKNLAVIEVSYSTNSNALIEHEAKKPTLIFSEDDQKEIDKIKEAISELDKKKDEIKAKQDEIEKANHTVNDSIVKYAEGKSRAETRLEKLAQDLQTMDEKIYNDYTLTYEEAYDLRDDNFVATESQHEINSLRGKIASLGNINFNAIEDYERESGDRDYWAKQIEDLTSAEKDLLSILQTVTNEMTEKFNNAFTQISQNFQKTFADLFGGGRAELVLVESETGDPLEQGVEIKMQPPGKNMRALSSFSGGEQALTSIAILFAILKLRPMPFAILDEIDAPLDETNAKRFALYLKRYSSDTKFIVITHKKPTMEVAEVLYGVTMEEQGVSRILTVSLKEASTFAKKNENETK